MVRRSTWILLIVFALLVVFAFLFQRYQANKVEPTITVAPTAALGKLYNLGDASVNEIMISDASGKQLDLYLDTASNNWAVKDVPVDQANSEQIEAISTQLQAVTIQETLSQTISLDVIGLINPSYTISMTTSTGTQLVTFVGSKTAIGSGYYVRVDAGPVEIVEKNALDDLINLLSEPPLLPTPTPEVTPTVAEVPSEPAPQTTPTP